MKRLLKVKIAWFPVWAIALLMMSMICVYLPVFNGAAQRLTDFPLVVVNEDEHFAQSAAGRAFMDQLPTSSGDQSFEWTEKPSKQKAVDYLKENKAYGAIVIPEDFSGSIAKVQQALQSGQSDAEPAHVEILINEGAGQIPTSAATSVLQQTADALSAAIVEQMTGSLSASGARLSPEAAALLEKPVAATTANALGLPSNVNKGMTPFILVMICSIGGLMGTQMIQGYTSKISERMREKGVKLTHSAVMLAEFVLSLVLGFGIALLAQIFVFGIFGASHSANVWKIFGFTLLSSWTMLFLFKTVSLVFGRWAMLLMFPINILGIFTSGGAFAITSLPDFHRFVSNFIPTRYLVDGLRSLLYYNGNMEAGLGLSLIVIVSYLVFFFAVCAIRYFHTYRIELAEDERPGRPAAGSTVGSTAAPQQAGNAAAPVQS
ncbi:YhgE/Pip domain-containing protein [Paenibacillus thailandensis]|uniref:YhgE/Pip domain-containing protein n=1 Tax=Paenibacillus thailandensis TaxID=393250 RepID=A0ABW5QX74_9BACL